MVRACFALAALFVMLSITAIVLHPYEHFKNNTWFLSWYKFAEFLQKYQLGVISAIGAALLSGIILILNGEKRHIILQLRTLSIHTNWIFTLVFLLFTAILAIYATTQQCVTGATLAILAILCISLYILGYLIRFNNDMAYYQREICSAILKLYTTQNKKIKSNTTDTPLNRYLLLLYPDVASNNNILQNDLGVLQYLLINTKFIPKEPWQDLTGFRSEFFLSIITPLIAKMRRTYQQHASEFVSEFINYTTNISQNDAVFNICLRYMILSVVQEYMINVVQYKTELDENEKSIAFWLKQNEETFYDIFGTSDYTFDGIIINDADSKDNKNHAEYKIYNGYLSAMRQVSLLTLPAYWRAEEKYIIKRKIVSISCHLPYNSFSYEVKEILLLTL